MHVFLKFNLKVGYYPFGLALDIRQSLVLKYVQAVSIIAHY